MRGFRRVKHTTTMSVPSSGRGQPTRHFSRPRNGGPPKGPSNAVMDNDWCWNDPHYAPILDFFQFLLPPSPHHLALIYHTPRNRPVNPSAAAAVHYSTSSFSPSRPPQTSTTTSMEKRFSFSTDRGVSIGNGYPQRQPWY